MSGSGNERSECTVKVTIFKASGVLLKTIDSPTHWEAQGPLLTVSHSTSEGVVSIKTTLPYYVEEGAGIAGAKAKAGKPVGQKPKVPPAKRSAWS
jgi:hypothetical protein